MITRKATRPMQIPAKTQTLTNGNQIEAKIRRARKLRREIEALKRQLTHVLGFNLNSNGHKNL